MIEINRNMMALITLEQYLLESKDGPKLDFINIRWNSFFKSINIHAELILNQIIGGSCKIMFDKIEFILTIQKLSKDAYASCDIENNRIIFSFYNFIKDLPEKNETIILETIKSILTNFPKTSIVRENHNKFKEMFFHEYMHLYEAKLYGHGYTNKMISLEKQRSEIKEPDEEKTFYFNAPHELNARIITAIIKTIENHGKIYGNFTTFADSVMDYFSGNKRLSRKNERRVIKRLYKFYEENL